MIANRSRRVKACAIGSGLRGCVEEINGWQIASSMRIVALDLPAGDLVHVGGAVGLLVACAKINEASCAL